MDYPTEDELADLRDWPMQTPGECRAVLSATARLWWPNPVDIDDNSEVTLVTGGWSGNEDLIVALRDNHVFWSLCWYSSNRAGVHVFRLPQPASGGEGGGAID